MLYVQSDLVCRQWLQLTSARNPLIELAQRLKNTHPRWRALAERMRSQGKAGSVIVAAVANRWMRGLFHRMQPLRQS